MGDNRPDSDQRSDRNPLCDHLPGLNIRQAVARLDGDRDLYLEMLGEYCAANRRFAATFRGLVSRGELKAARRAAHSLKGAAGNMGADDLQRAALALEQACSAEAIDQITERLPAVETALARVLAAAATLTATADAPEPAAAPADETVNDPVALAGLLDALAAGLSALDPVGSQKCLEKIRTAGVPPPLAADLQTVAECIGQYDFETAAQRLRQLLRDIRR